VAVALVVAALAACGKRGAPVAPVRRVPARVADAEARRLADRIELRFTVPATNSDGTSPPTIDRVEVYRLTLGAKAAAPTIAQVATPANLKTTLLVRPPGEPGAAPPTTPDVRPAAGEATTVVDTITGDAVGAADAPVAHYVLVGVAGRRKGPLSPIVSVPLGTLPAVPADLKPTHDEKTLTLTWSPGTAGQKFRVYVIANQSTPNDRKLLTPEPIAEPTFTLPVELGKEQCFTITAVETVGKTTVEGAGLGPACVTPDDRFAPPAPQNLRAVPATGTVILDWPAVEVPDLAGYIVLRTNGTNDTLAPLTREPIAETTYEDKNVQAGVTYVYAVVAVDRAGNQSPASDRKPATVR
jgi:predicted small lipoprotein YifL